MSVYKQQQQQQPQQQLLLLILVQRGIDSEVSMGCFSSFHQTLRHTLTDHMPCAYATNVHSPPRLRQLCMD